MVQTRRQSGKLPPPRYAPVVVESAATQSDDEDGDEHDGFSSDLTEFESDEEDKDVYNGPPARKRAKTSALPSTGTTPTAKAAPLGAKVVGKKRVGKLSMLPQIPLDILFEIFGHLTPKDLLNLSCTDKLLRKTLMSRKSLSIWKNVRLAAEVPDGPDGMSEPAWAELIFGTTCQNCGAKGVTNIDFAIQKRCCVSCRKKHLVYAGRFEKKFPDFNPEIMELIPYTSNGGWAHGHSSSSKFFWEEDVHAACKALATYQKAVHMRTPGAKAALDEWKESKMEEVTRIVEASLCHRYVLVFLNHGSVLGGAEIAKKRVADIISRPVALGWDERDVERLRYRLDRDSSNKKELTDRGFRMIKPGLEASLAQYKAQRIAQETRARREARAKLLSSTYFDYKKTLPIKEWAFIPRLVDFMEMREMKEWVECDAEMGENGLGREVLERLFGEWSEGRKVMVEGLVREGLGSGLMDVESGQIAVGQAFPVFLCTSKGCAGDTRTSSFSSRLRSPAIIGIESALAHSCRVIVADPFRTIYYARYPDGELELAELKFCKRGGEAVDSILKLLGLDGEGGDDVVGEMDRVDARFVCEGCEPVAHKKVSRKLVKTWRQCVDHYIECDNDWHTTPSWKLLDEKKRKAVVQQQRDDAAQAHHWICGHCTYNAVKEGDKRTVVTHCKATHTNNSKPVEGKDIFYNPRLIRLQPKEIYMPYGSQAPVPVRKAVAVGGDGVFLCKRCDGKGRQRHFQLQGVQQHLRDKHKVGVEESKLDVDFEKLKGT
ncbi:hypothetical protein JAAARDRAFT_200826 [Jaapia argillacea MUCL 33604]|uniref:F-box domain-containing protein n=1 Tax=Jaapia argillacea MUCL 33604 TaxID=933084 RepID=A0A067P6Q2_9AGAM|nr:hypothetical protein JAAARDRAFT_200826 [Jaapia argillacea MUCL 33604]